MKIIFHKNFVKKYGKLRPNEKKKFKERRDIFLQNQYDPMLNNHSLCGAYVGYRSINLTGDLRIVYKFLNKDEVVFAEIGSHS